MAIAVVWNAHKTEQYEGTVFKKYENGAISLDLRNGLRYYCTRDRIISISGEIETTIKESTEDNDTE